MLSAAQRRLSLALAATLVAGSSGSAIGATPATAPADPEKVAQAGDGDGGEAEVEVDKSRDAAEPAPKKHEKKRHKKKHRRSHRPAGALTGSWRGWQLGADAGAATEGGGLVGHRTLRENAVFVGAGAEIETRAERGRWRAGASLDVGHRETQGASLRESKSYLEAELGHRWGPKLRVTGEARLGGVWRPGWPDQYQPLADGSYEPTDRYSHWDRRVGATVAGIPLRHHHARARYRYELVDYRQDPDYDPQVAPTHLVPADYGEHQLDLSWRYFGRGWKLGGALDSFVKDYYFVFSRDAGTGKTHAGAGGPPPNPLQTIRGLEPQVTGELSLLHDAVELDAGYGYELVQDAYQGYYSFTGHHPTLAVAWRLRPGTELAARGELWWRTYGPDSYAVGGDHPPLLYGDRRVDHRARARLGLRTRLAPHWTGVADLTLRVRRTNFPTYEPGVFPSSREYDIDWRYDNWVMSAGVEYHL